jgi:alpha/beta superfamily hydrolase
MAAPLGIACCYFGTSFGYLLVRKRSKNALPISLVYMLLTPLIGSTAQQRVMPVECVTSFITKDADLETVWNHVIEFPRSESPEEWLFKTGMHIQFTWK